MIGVLLVGVGFAALAARKAISEHESPPAAAPSLPSPSPGPSPSPRAPVVREPRDPPAVDAPELAVGKKPFVARAAPTPIVRVAPAGKIAPQGPPVPEVAGQVAAAALSKVPVLGTALEVVSLPGKLATALGAGPVPNVAAGAVTALVGSAEVLLGVPDALFGGGVPMYYTTAGGKELARRIKASMDLDETGRATSAKWQTR